MAAGDGRCGGLRDDGRCFVSSFYSTPSSSADLGRPFGDDDGDISVWAMDDLRRGMSFADDQRRPIDPDADRRGGSGGRWLSTADDSFIQPPLPRSVFSPSALVGGGPLLGRGLGVGGRSGGKTDVTSCCGAGSGGGSDDLKYVPSSQLHYQSSSSSVRDSTHAFLSRPFLPPQLFHPDAFDRASAPLDAGVSSGQGVTGPTTLDPWNAIPSSTSVDDSATLNELNELQYTFDNLPLLSDDEEADYLFLTQNLGSLQSSIYGTDSIDTMTAHEMLPQYPITKISPGSMIDATAEQLDNKLVDHLLEDDFPTADVQIIRESSTSTTDRQTVAAATGSRKVLKANRRLNKNKPASTTVPASQTSISKCIGEKPNQAKMSQYVIRCLTNFGFCVVDRYMGSEVGTQILNEVVNLEMMGLFRDGQLISQTNDKQTIRGDKIVWVERDTKGLRHIPVLIRHLDILMESLNGQVGAYQIKSRSKAMVACYPGHGKGYMRHVDNATEDGRCITCIYYLNKDWNAETDGGLLRMYPVKVPVSVNIEPNFDRLLLFWSDHRNPHEVQPAFRERHAITVWYFDSIERQRYLQQGTPDHQYSENRLSPISMSYGSRSKSWICDNRSDIL